MAEETKTTPVPAPTPEAPKLNVFGRPREYDPAYHLTQTRLYLDGGIREIEMYSTIENKYMRVKLPQVAGLASFMKVGRNTIYEWMKIYPDFRDTIEQLLTQQEEMLIEYGLNNQFNSTITKLLLGKHGYSDKTDVTTNGKDITPDNQTAANAAIASFLTQKKPEVPAPVAPAEVKPKQDGPAANTTIQPKGKDPAAV